MKIDVNSEIRELASLFPKSLYIVGGAVRDALTGRTAHDVDIASALRAEEVIDLLEDSRFDVGHQSLKLGTLYIAGNSQYEYTAFRKDSYAGDGSHTPSGVEFVNDISVDARRRDFTINAIYADASSGEIVDPLGGLEDIKARVVRAVRDPDEVIKEDALRIMRFARFVSSLGFEADKATLEACKNNARALRLIAPERIREELEKILIADTVYGVKGAQVRGIELLREIGALDVVLPELCKEGYAHALRVLAVAPPDLRLAAALRAALATADTDGTDEARKILVRLRYSTAMTDYTCLLIGYAHNDFASFCEGDLRVFALRHYKVIPDLIALLKAEELAEGGAGFGALHCKLLQAYLDISSEGIPLGISDLPVKGGDLEGLGVPPHMRSAVLRALLERGVNDESVRTEQGAVEFIKNYISDNK